MLFLFSKENLNLNGINANYYVAIREVSESLDSHIGEYDYLACVSIQDSWTVFFLFFFTWLLTFMRNTVNWPLISALKRREGPLGWPGGGGVLFSHRGGLNEAAVEGVLWVMVGYWEQKTNAKVKRSVRGFFFTVLQDKQSALTQSHSKVVESIGLTNSVEK